MSAKRTKASRELTSAGFVVRLVGALVLVIATYNPSYSFVEWVRNAMAEDVLGPEHFFVGVLLLIGWSIYIGASYRSLGALGLILAVAFFSTLVWLLIDVDLLSLGSATAVTWVVLICLAALLAIGVSWSHVWRRLTGQFEVDED